MGNEVRVTLFVDEVTARKLKSQAALSGRTPSQLVAAWVREGLLPNWALAGELREEVKVERKQGPPNECVICGFKWQTPDHVCGHDS